MLTLNPDSSLTNLTATTFEFLFASVEGEKWKDLIVGVIYRPLQYRFFSKN